MVDKLVLAKSPDSPCARRIIFYPDWIQHLRPSRARRHLESAVIKEKLSGCHPALVSADCPPSCLLLWIGFNLNLSKYLVHHLKVPLDLSILHQNEGPLLFMLSLCSVEGREIYFLAGSLTEDICLSAPGVELTFSKQFATTSLSSDELQCISSSLFLITLRASTFLHIFYTLIPFCFLPIKKVHHQKCQ